MEIMLKGYFILSCISNLFLGHSSLNVNFSQLLKNGSVVHIT